MSSRIAQRPIGPDKPPQPIGWQPPSVIKATMRAGLAASKIIRKSPTTKSVREIASEPGFEGGRAGRRAPSSTRNWISIPQPALLPSRKHQEGS